MNDFIFYFYFFRYLRMFSKRNRAFILNLTFWVIIYLINLSTHLFVEETGKSSYRIGPKSLMLLFYLIAVIVASYFIVLRVFPLLFEKVKIARGIFELVIGVYIICVLSRISVVYLLEPLLGISTGVKEPILELALDFYILFTHYLIGIITGSIPFFLFYLLADRYKIQQKQIQLEKEKKAIELAALKSQLNPHFLFNTLNNIYSLTLHQSPLAPTCIEKLSYILDYTLYRCNSKYVTLKSECDLLTNYIELEKIRYSDRLEVRIDFNVDGSYNIAPLLLLSLVENMFKHGVEKTVGNAILHIELNVANNSFSLITKNSFDLALNDEQGIGLRNVKRQLQLIYPGIHSLKTEKIHNIFRLELQIQLL